MIPWLSGTALWFDAIVCVGRLINEEVGRDDHALHAREERLNSPSKSGLSLEGQFVSECFYSHWLVQY